MAMSKLRPTSITLHSELKFFRLGDNGSSDGTSMGITFEVPEGLAGKDLRIEMLREKRALDLMVLNAEMLKGSIDATRYEKRKAVLIQQYDKALKGLTGDEPTDA